MTGPSSVSQWAKALPAVVSIRIMTNAATLPTPVHLLMSPPCSDRLKDVRWYSWRYCPTGGIPCIDIRQYAIKGIGPRVKINPFISRDPTWAGEAPRDCGDLLSG